MWKRNPMRPHRREVRLHTPQHRRSVEGSRENGKRDQQKSHGHNESRSTCTNGQWGIGTRVIIWYVIYGSRENGNRGQQYGYESRLTDSNDYWCNLAESSFWFRCIPMYLCVTIIYIYGTNMVYNLRCNWCRIQHLTNLYCFWCITIDMCNA